LIDFATQFGAFLDDDSSESGNDDCDPIEQELAIPSVDKEDVGEFEEDIGAEHDNIGDTDKMTDPVERTKKSSEGVSHLP
jgi:hypothetical protein